MKRTYLFILLIGCFFSSFEILAQGPMLSWATYLGSTSADNGRAVARDTAGNIYVAGIATSSSGIATSGAFQMVYGGGSGDAFLAKFSPSGTLLWATYFGGTDNDAGLCLAADGKGNVYFGGYTRSSSGISTANSFQPVHGGNNDAFLAKFSASGSLVWSTYYGGSGSDQANALAVDNNGNIYMAGITRSNSDISTAGTHQPVITSTTADEGFLIKFDSTGNRIWGTYYGGSGNDNFYSLGCDAWGNVYASGWVSANSTSGIASANAFQTAYGGGNFDAILVKFSPSGTRIWGTYFGGNLVDQAQKVLVTDTSGIFLSGATSSTGISTVNAWQATIGGQADAFLARFDTAGQRIWTTYYGGTALDQGDAVVADEKGHVYLCGLSASATGVAIPGIIKDTVDVRDVYIAKFTTTGTRLWGTYIGGDNVDAPYSALYDKGRIYITGQTNSITNFATANAFQTTPGGSGSYDAFLIKVSDCPPLDPPSGIAGDSVVCRGGVAGYITPSLPDAQSYTWTLPNGWSLVSAGTSDSISVVVNVTGSGMVTDTIRVSANYVCGSSADTFMVVTVAPKVQLSPSGTLSVCTGDSLTLYATTAFVNSWQWLHNGNLLNATDSILKVTQPGYYTVITTNAACSDTSVADTITLLPSPQPVISMSGNNLTTGSFAGYQWYHNGTAIAGATSQSYTMIALAGTYTVEVMDTNGCKGMSADYIPTGIATTELHPEIRIYPNPVTDVLTVEAPCSVTITISSIDGKIIRQLADTTKVDMSGLAGGLYFVRIADLQGSILCTQKLLKP